MFITLGDVYVLKWGKYRGDYMGIYNYNNLSEKGYVDVDWFNYEFGNK